MENYEDMILPDDFQADTTPQAEETEVNQEQEQQTEETTTTPGEEVQQQEQTPEQQPAVSKFKVKFNHEERELGYDEAVPLIQKGMNYDKLSQQINSLKADPRLNFVEELAQANNMTVEQYITAVKQSQYEAQVQELVQKNIPEEYAREMLENKKFRQETQSKQKAEAEQKTKQEAEAQMVREFAEAFPGVTADQLPDEVLIKVQNGVPLKYAYMEHQMSQMQNEIKILKTNKTNEKKAPVGSTAVHGSKDTDIEDDFLRGFNSI